MFYDTNKINTCYHDVQAK